MKRKVLAIWLSAIAMALTYAPTVHAGPILSPWQFQNDMVVAGHAFGDAVVGGNIYAFGGNAPGVVYGTNRVQKYNAATDTWGQVASMPTARHSLNCAVVDGYIYAIGGHVYNSRSENERYDPSADTWQHMASKPTAVSGLGVAAFAGKIYTFGGNRYGSYQSVIEVYDPSTNTWSDVGNMPAAGEPWAAATLGDKIYLAGGLLGGRTDNFWAYEPVSGTWDTSLPRLNIARTSHELVVVGDYLFAIGGTAGNCVEWWTPGALAWTLDESLNVARSQLGSEAVGHTIYAFGGYAGGNLSSTESAIVCEPPEPPKLLFRERNTGIPGIDHCGLYTGTLDEVWESTKPKNGGAPWPRLYYDPLKETFVEVGYDNGVQNYHTLGSFNWFSTSKDSSDVVETDYIDIDSNIAEKLIEFIEDHESSGYSSLTKGIQPEDQKGGGGTFTCVGLIEAAAESVSDLHEGEGFIPNIFEATIVPDPVVPGVFWNLPLLTPSLLRYCVRNEGLVWSTAGALAGWFDPVDFILTDPLGRRLGHVAGMGTFEEIPNAMYSGDGDWEILLILDPIPGEYYLELYGVGSEYRGAVTSINNDSTGPSWVFSGYLETGERLTKVLFANWTVLELLPASKGNKAGRTMPVKFSLRIAERVDPAMPFVYNEDLEIKIYDSADPGTILQTSLYGETSTDYRIDQAGELYITNFKTKKQPAEYTVEVWRTGLSFPLGSFNFQTVTIDVLQETTNDTGDDEAFEVQEAAGFTLFEASERIDELDPDNFNNEDSATALTNEIYFVLSIIDDGLYTDALYVLENDILERTNGCADIGEPDENDWITTYEGQGEVYPLIVEAIELLESLI